MKLILVDDDTIVLNALGETLRATGEFSSIEAFGSAWDALNGADWRTVDVVLADVNMPDVSGIDLTRKILARNPRVKVVLLTSFDDETFLQAGLAAGASGFLLKITPPDEILRGLKSVLAGMQVVTGVTAERLNKRALRPLSNADNVELSEREGEVLKELCRGASNRAIAKGLGLAEGTVKLHVSNLMVKLEANSRLHIVVRAFQLGLADLPRCDQAKVRNGA